MDRALYVAMTGAKQSMLAQEVFSHNLANATTTGFKADYTQFMSYPIYGAGYDSRSYALARDTAVDFSQGSLQTTHRELDIALNHEQAWLSVQAPDGSEAYTRMGNLQIGATGLLTTGTGYLLLGNGGPISVPPSEKIEIAQDGTVSVRANGQGSNALVVLDRIKVVRGEAEKMMKGQDGLFRAKDNNPLNADSAMGVVTGALESSNVNAIGSLLQMINLSRNFELQVKFMQESNQNAQMTAQLLQS